MTNGHDECIAQMKPANMTKLHYSRDKQCAHVIQSHKATVVMTDGTVNLTDIFIGNIGPAKVFQRQTSLYQFLNQVTSFSDTYNNILMVVFLSLPLSFSQQQSHRDTVELHCTWHAVLQGVLVIYKA